MNESKNLRNIKSKLKAIKGDRVKLKCDSNFKLVSRPLAGKSNHDNK